MASRIQHELADGSLPRSLARLYSQHTKLRLGQTGLSSWEKGEAARRLSDAVRLVDVALLRRDSDAEDWRHSMRRAGEILEWLSHPELNPEALPFVLLSAAAYQIAGYPARATGLLDQSPVTDNESQILHDFLKANFVGLFASLQAYWAAGALQDSPSPDQNIIDWPSVVDSAQFSELLVREIASSLGVLCMSMRWGDDARLQKASNKLSALAKLFLYGTDSYSWLLAKLSAETAKAFISSSLRRHTRELLQSVDETGKAALERYVRISYNESKALAWPSQIKGIERLSTRESFALCTPTGSGKTTVAELAILQSLFPLHEQVSRTNDEDWKPAPLSIYLVPSRALAAEVEAKLSKVIRRLIDGQRIVVTGLYGGIDWGPTDAWLTSDEPAVLICTYEKGEALLRFLGPLFINRVSQVVIDEAHSVQFRDSFQTVSWTENRALRLESLGARLLHHLQGRPSRVVALSAVASEFRNALASWVSHQSNAAPVTEAYRSTRQLIGTLQCRPDGYFQIRYDRLDGNDLAWEQGEEGAPYVDQPFPPYPAVRDSDVNGPRKRLRPYLLWAALNFATPDDAGKERSVLISITSRIAEYADGFLTLLQQWEKQELPRYFNAPTDPEKHQLWEECLKACEDYFTRNSREYELLLKGIALHHGSMPARLARHLVEIIEARIVRIALATSTLSEGINLPFETVLIPNVTRYSQTQAAISVSEFGNLVGRAGRPGFGTEGQALVLLIHPHNDKSSQQAREFYEELMTKLTDQPQSVIENQSPQSPLAQLIVQIEKQWRQLMGPTVDQSEFYKWLEKTVPQGDTTLQEDPLATLDVLDGILLAAIVEIEQLQHDVLTPDEMEHRLQDIWRNTYAHYAASQEQMLKEIFIRRGRALRAIYPDRERRRRLYHTSLPPALGRHMLSDFSKIRERFEAGSQYANWENQEKFNFIREVVSSLIGLPIPNLQVEKRAGTTHVEWQNLLHWWLDPDHAPTKPTRKQLSNWYRYINRNFSYRVSWALGSFMALVFDEVHGGELRASSLEDWPETDLPWIAFWLKELLQWGTLDPVAAYLLSRRCEVTRSEAELASQRYYKAVSLLVEKSNDPLDASIIRRWVDKDYGVSSDKSGSVDWPKSIPVQLLRDFSLQRTQEWRVIPVKADSQIFWYDPAGFQLAASELPRHWQSSWVNSVDFKLDPDSRVVTTEPYA